MKTLLSPKFFFITVYVIYLQSLTLYAQTTAIPDPNFEQALINLGIDSDGIINGQVLTSDIENVLTLDVSAKGINNLTGIEGFAALEELDASYNNMANMANLDLGGNLNLKKLTLIDLYNLTSISLINNTQLEYLESIFNPNLSALDVTNNINLKELILGDDHQMSENNIIQSLDLSNNSLLEKLWITEMPSLEYINLKNNDHSLLTDLFIDCIIEGIDCGSPPCMEVDDISVIDFNVSPYNLWYANVIFSEDCMLSTSTFKSFQFFIFPNPVGETLFIQNIEETESFTALVYNLNGRLLYNQTLTPFQREIDIKLLSNGIYFLLIENKLGEKQTEKFVKK
jgi:hypothetical protein